MSRARSASRGATAKKSGAVAAAPPKPRVRRPKDEARALILDACMGLLIDHGPQGVGLVDVARRAGVSHGLVSHYFGSIDALIEAALERYAELQRTLAIEQIESRPDLGPRAWLEAFFAWASRKETARMVAWSFLSGMITKEDFFSRRVRGAERVVDAVMARMAADPKGPQLPRADVDFLVLLSLAATHGYALGREGYWPSLGVDAPGSEQDRWYFDRLADLVELFVAAKSPKT